MLLLLTIMLRLLTIMLLLLTIILCLLRTGQQSTTDTALTSPGHSQDMMQNTGEAIFKLCFIKEGEGEIFLLQLLKMVHSTNKQTNK